ncbi:hypothetical protein OG765_00305 [Streptomyces sp. NBC_00555]|uniref:hypothetical protein n=1 Tax=unclassified Streptomyces TaxID=2593676 RepID=UPI00214BFFDE|nr:MULTISPECIES: hypothetical protein [unclassified Streptomyces]MCX5009458.1 hypothetical protein [Streptomyces sp. NBC_00555]UUU44353.1 hypothetical protein JIW86_39850 [Streptomyces sp. NBC_00162]
MTKRHTLTTAVLTLGAAILAAVPAHADITDGSANNLDIIDHISALTTNINSDPTTSEVRNANTRADGHKNNSTFQ